MSNLTMNQTARQRVVVPVLHQSFEDTLSVDGLFGRLQTVVSNTRKTHPELTDYHLHDVALRMEEGELRAVLDFRK
ncbi:hypothetical protein [Alicyclobacillus ferrooxydans]|uniref:Uncharacterized protein n=1 Tax=Alicyclobacillus ferrooxydans TaxID=471514 RepID=A0A0P9GG27_9BACL|nr:hypothetical protein [Alicyclobacillus ferrooxydans]KPV38979.1 hypothetical protein AN477_23465 [Alicyclobacillus ferrooxydans]